MAEMLRKCDALEGQLTAQERTLRQEALSQLRAFIRTAAEKGGLNADQGVFKKSFPRRPLGDIRVDLDVLKGSACVPDPPDLTDANGN